MPGTMRPAVKGEPVRLEAADWNALLDVARRARAGEISGGAAGMFLPRLTGSVISVRNDTAAAMDRFSAVALGGPILDPTYSVTTTAGDPPVTTTKEVDNPAFFARPPLACGLPADDVSPCAVLLEPLAAGAIGRAIVAGVTVARVMLNAEGDPRAEIAAGEALLQSGPCGRARILWTEPLDTGEETPLERWAIVELSAAEPPILFAKLQAHVLGTDQTATVKLLDVATNEEIGGEFSALVVFPPDDTATAHAAMFLGAGRAVTIARLPQPDGLYGCRFVIVGAFPPAIRYGMPTAPITGDGLWTVRPVLSPEQPDYLFDEDYTDTVSVEGTNGVAIANDIIQYRMDGDNIFRLIGRPMESIVDVGLTIDWVNQQHTLTLVKRTAFVANHTVSY